jgi:hypothetical protein
MPVATDFNVHLMNGWALVTDRGGAAASVRRPVVVRTLWSGYVDLSKWRGLRSGLCRWRWTDLQSMEKFVGCRRHGFNRFVERSGIGPARGSHSADLAHVLQRGGSHVFFAGVFLVRRTQRLDAPAHVSRVTVVLRFAEVGAVRRGWFEAHFELDVAQVTARSMHCGRIGWSNPGATCPQKAGRCHIIL